jgi:hypothetical protein
LVVAGAAHNLSRPAIFECVKVVLRKRLEKVGLVRLETVQLAVQHVHLPGGRIGRDNILKPGNLNHILVLHRGCQRVPSLLDIGNKLFVRRNFATAVIRDEELAAGLEPLDKAVVALDLGVVGDVKKHVARVHHVKGACRYILEEIEILIFFESY